MKKAIVIGTLIVLAGCSGGGGGGNDGVDARASCRAYCDFSCSKAHNCLAIPEALDPNCGEECLATIDRDGGLDADRCRSAEETVIGMSCHELATALGFARTIPSSKSADESVGGRCGNVDGVMSGEQ